MVPHQGHPVAYLDVRKTNQRPDLRPELVVSDLALRDDRPDFGDHDLGDGLVFYHDHLVLYGFILGL